MSLSQPAGVFGTILARPKPPNLSLPQTAQRHGLDSGPTISRWHRGRTESAIVIKILYLLNMKMTESGSQ